MNIDQYRERRARLASESPQFRDLCLTCMQPEFGCYCSHLRPFDAKMKFVILIHKIEARRRIATGRMSHLTLKNSELIQGQDYSSNERVNALLEDPRYQPMVLYPGRDSLDLSRATEDQKQTFVRKTPLIFVIDGTWATARKTMRLSENIKTLPRICFRPQRPSRFRVRKQPGVDCYSTIEAIHQTIELIGRAAGFNVASGQHDALLNVFDVVVERQLEFLRRSYQNPRTTAYRRPRHPELPAYLKASNDGLP